MFPYKATGTISSRGTHKYIGWRQTKNFQNSHSGVHTQCEPDFAVHQMPHDQTRASSLPTSSTHRTFFMLKMLRVHFNHLRERSALIAVRSLHI